MDLVGSLLILLTLLAVAAWVWSYVVTAELPPLRLKLIGGFCFKCSYDCRSLLGQADQCPECGADIRNLRPVNREYAMKWKTPSVWYGFVRAGIVWLVLSSCCVLPSGPWVIMLGLLPAVLLTIFVTTMDRSLSELETLYITICGGGMQWLFFFAYEPFMNSHPVGWACAFMTSGGFGVLLAVALVRHYLKERVQAAARNS